MKNNQKQLKTKEKTIRCNQKHQERLKIIKDNQIFQWIKSRGKKKLLDDLKEEKNTIDLEKLVRAKFDGTIFNFSTFKNSLDLPSKYLS